jgi:hypothetical protein
MPISLGPMTPHLRVVVSRWIEEGRRTHPRRTEEAINALFVTGGPAGCSYLDADGEVWNWDPWDDSFSRVEDGPRKMGLIVIAADYLKELASWLPARPADASTCHVCRGCGWLPPPWPRVQHPACSGLGWVSH